MLEITLQLRSIVYQKLYITLTTAASNTRVFNCSNFDCSEISHAHLVLTYRFVFAEFTTILTA